MAREHDANQDHGRVPLVEFRSGVDGERGQLGLLKISRPAGTATGWKPNYQAIKLILGSMFAQRRRIPNGEKISTDRRGAAT